jgi:multidrug efflux pump subunit AcrB
LTLSEFSLKNRYTVYALFIGAVIFGLMAYFTLPIQLFPDTSPPLINVMTAYPGAVAEDVANLVSDPIETEMGALEGVHRVSSKSQDGLSLVEVEFKYGNSTDLAAIDVQNAVSNIRSRLPLQISEPQIMKFSTSNRPVLTIGLKGENLVEIRSLASNVIAMEVQRVSGVANVDVFGGNRAEISVDVDRDRLDAHGLSLLNLTEAIRSHNISAPAGQIRSEGRQYTFRIDEESLSINNLAEIPISLPGGGAVYLGNLAAIREGSGEDQSRFRVNGNAAIAVQVFKQNDANTVEVVKSVQNKFSELNNRYPNIEMIVADEDASFTQQVVSNMLGAVVQALLLATIIIFLFLGSFRRGLVVAISMPMSFLLTFAGMKLFGIQVDLVTLTAVILSVGMVVDASVVVLENISRRYLEQKLTPFEAALAGAKEIQFSVIAGNVTTITVLIPLLFLYGFVGKTFGPLAATMIIAFVSSLLVALSLVPILTMLVTQSKVSKMENLAQKISAPWVFIMEKLRYAYIKILTAALYNRWIVYSTAMVLLVLGMLIIRSQGMELLPKMDSGSIFITVETPSGSSLGETENVLSQIEEIVMEESEVLGISTQIGFEPGMVSLGGGGVQGPTQGFMTVKLTPRTERKETIWDIQV